MEDCGLDDGSFSLLDRKTLKDRSDVNFVQNFFLIQLDSF